MARRGVLGGFTLDLFGGGGVDAGVFNIASQSRQNEAYLALTRVEVQWEAGKVSNADYLAALATYVGTFPADSAERLNQQSRLESTTYRIERNVLVSQIESGTREWSDLLAFDQSKLAGLNPDSQEYLDRQNRLFNTQGQILADEEKDVVERYSDGKMTTAQLSEWYKDRLSDGRFTGNTELLEQVGDRVDELNDRIIDERDSRVINDYSAGKISPTEFLSYASLARGRYAEGTTQATEWDNRIEGARDSVIEDDLNYRYGLSQDYLRLKQFIAGNTAPKGGVSTSTSKRTVLDANGNWKVVTQTTSKPYAPSKAEQEAYRKRQVEIAEAKKQMARIEKKLAGMAGGFVQTGEMMAYYQRQLGRVARGSQEWYSIQSKIDGLAEQQSAEKILSRQGIKVSYPKVKSEKKETFELPGTSGGGGGGASAASAATPAKAAKVTSLDEFMRVIAKVESGGRYDARNKSSGAYGKYQILPSNWPSWARQAGLGADAEPTPENQEKVARWKMEKLYKRFDGDFAKMAAAWHMGVNASMTGNWGPNTRRYVSNVMGRLGSDYSPGRSSGQGTTTYSRGGGGGTGTSAPTAKGKATAKGGDKPGLKAVTGVEVKTVRRSGPMTILSTTDLPFPKGMDARQFRKIYDAMESAWQNGEQVALIDVGGGQRMTVFLGDDPDERNAIMGELDDMRIALADVEHKAYIGTGSEASKSQSALAARKDAARHDMLVLDLAGTAKGSSKVNPLAQADRILDRVVSGITAEVAAGNAAFKRGDMTVAYLHFERAQQMADGEIGDLDTVIALYNKAEIQISGIERKTGLSRDQILSGAGKAGTEMKSTLERATTFNTEIEKALLAGDENATVLNNALKKNPDGTVKWTKGGVDGQVVLDDDQLIVLKPDGTAELVLTDGVQVREDGTFGPSLPDDMVPTMVRSGTSIIPAATKYKIGIVGYAKMPDGSKVPMYGKVITTKIDNNGDGVAETTQTYFQNPLTGKKWSSTPIMFNAPKGSTVVASSTSKNLSITYQKDGVTYTISPDDKTGVYQVWSQSYQGGIAGIGATLGEPVLLGPAASNPVALAAIGDFGRDTQSLTAGDKTMSDLPAPMIGMDADDIRDLNKPDPATLVRANRVSRDGAPFVTNREYNEKRIYQSQQAKKLKADPESSEASRYSLQYRGQADFTLPPRETVTPGDRALSLSQTQTGLGAGIGNQLLPAVTLSKLPTKGGALITRQPTTPPSRDVGPVSGAERQTPLAPVTAKRAAPVKRKTPAKGIRKVKPLPKPKPKPLPAAITRAKYERIEKSGV